MLRKCHHCHAFLISSVSRSAPGSCLDEDPAAAVRGRGPPPLASPERGQKGFEAFSSLFCPRSVFRSLFLSLPLSTMFFWRQILNSVLKRERVLFFKGNTKRRHPAGKLTVIPDDNVEHGRQYDTQADRLTARKKVPLRTPNLKLPLMSTSNLVWEVASS